MDPLLNYRAAPSAAPMVAVIIKLPIVPIFAMIIGFLNIAVNFPAPFLKGTALHRSFHLRVMLLAIQFVITILFYQVCWHTVHYSQR